MKINAGEIRVGMLLEYKNDLWQVLKTQHVKPGKGGAFAQIEMKIRAHTLCKKNALSGLMKYNSQIILQIHVV